MTTSTHVKMTAQQENRFAELTQSTYRKVFNMAYRLTGSRPDAEDLTQEAFFRAYRSFSDYEGDKPFDNWILRILSRLFLDLLRSRRRRVQAVSYDNPVGVAAGDDNAHFDLPDSSATPEQILMEHNFSEPVQKAMNTLTAEQRLLITLADIEELPYKDIAEILNTPVGTIRSRLHRTHKVLRSKLEDQAKAVKPKMSPKLVMAR